MVEEVSQVEGYSEDESILSFERMTSRYQPNDPNKINNPNRLFCN